VAAPKANCGKNKAITSQIDHFFDARSPRAAIKESTAKIADVKIIRFDRANTIMWIIPAMIWKMASKSTFRRSALNIDFNLVLCSFEAYAIVTAL
jgi:hypothetical protein